jgi:hypothetical protein
MSERPTSFALSLRSDNVKALLLIKAISNENFEAVAKIINSAPTQSEKLSIINSITIQDKNACETTTDKEALLKLAAENRGGDTANIMLLVRCLINQANNQSQINIDLSLEREKFEEIKNSSLALDLEIESLLKKHEITNLAGNNGYSNGGSSEN